jgi:hypothetical protein
MGEPPQLAGVGQLAPGAAPGWPEPALADGSEPGERLRLAVVASAIYDYGFQIKRLDRLVGYDLSDSAASAARPLLKR